jgi:hypothetical protein
MSDYPRPFPITGSETPSHVMLMRERQFELLSAALHAVRISDIKLPDRHDVYNMLLGIRDLVHQDDKFVEMLHELSGSSYVTPIPMVQH